MKLYLVRHGSALSEDQDPARPLSQQGLAEVGCAAGAARGAGVKPAAVLHSGKARARQTAELLASALGVDDVRDVGGVLTPNAEPAAALERVEREDGPLMLVGHLPHLGRLASLLLVDDPELELIRFDPAAVACLERGDAGWGLTALISPDWVSSAHQP